MEKRLVEILYKMKGDFSLNSLQKVFCSFHPADISHLQKLRMTSCQWLIVRFFIINQRPIKQRLI